MTSIIDGNTEATIGGKESFYVIDTSDLRGISRDILILVIGTGAQKSELIDEAIQHGFEVRYY